MPVVSPLRATARLQFHKDFTLDDAIPVVAYLADLGISHVYASPLLHARRGSTHGYDVVDYGEIDPELGGEAAFERFSAALAARGLGLIMDFVPNHMGVGPENAWWMDVLAYGRDSRHASFFDIDWESRTSPGRLFLPILGKPYPEALLDGDIGLLLEEGRLVIDCHGQHLPASIASIALLLDRAALGATGETARKLEALAGRFDALADPREDSALHRAFAQLLSDDEAARRSLEAVAGAVAPGQKRGAEQAEALDAYLELQHYRLAFWRGAPFEINYRRFFEINELAAIRIEEKEVFDAAHRWVLEQVRQGRLQGLRLDHIDGLLDPLGYLRRLRQALEEAGAGPDFAVLVEKILAPGEDLPADWPVEGTTGYETMDAIQSVLVDHGGKEAVIGAYEAFTGETRDIETAIFDARKEILEGSFAGSVEELVQQLADLSRQYWRYADLTHAAISTALIGLVQAFGVYRTYVAPDGSGPREGLDAALEAAATRLEGEDRRALDFLGAVFGGGFEVGRKSPSRGGDALTRAARQASQRFQHLTSPVAAKAVEDTAFYRVFPLSSLNEVGGSPERFGITPETFHAFALRQQARHPLGLVALATHDHKRGPDLRARLSLLAELAAEWGDLLPRLGDAAAAWRYEVGATQAPSAAHEYLAYQTLLGMRPLEAGGPPLDERLGAYLLKAAREGKERTSWTKPDEAYEAALEQFAKGIATAPVTSAFAAEIEAVIEPLERGGAIKSLAQVAIQLTMPGVPDLYQGADRWDFSLVDPDNRRPVDWESRAAALATFEAASLDELQANWRDGRIKQWLIWRLLQIRRAAPTLFKEGAYEPLVVTFPQDRPDGTLLAFARSDGQRRLCTIVPRFIKGHLQAEGGLGLVGFDGAVLDLPSSSRATDLLTGQAHEGEVLELAPLLTAFPLVLLMIEPAG
ncbi:maltooligosyl trehalose synthase [Arboricoccus pini]|uniref:Maltooligosyl trehalose synthase n=1 Tax=Arboricoccus pini TaxID=1963835 RepID=A0A212RZL9_9PROT|nr:malto-oligosyltrehalose synthase [Arboricoccus pini]SNB78357.1 maltooligosyl trehalose synthase [Arboricoccus pini]